MAQADSTSKPFKVIVIGGGIVGLSLSHALQLANIDHVVLEKHSKIISIRGAALIIWPGVARIFDQFGFLDKLHKVTTPVIKESQRWPDGSLHIRGNTMQKLSKLFQLEPILFDRQACVTHLYENLPDKSRIHTNRRLERIEHTETGVRVHLSDGSVEEGDMVVGADGVHSSARTQMWDYARTSDPAAIPESDKSALFSDFGGLFGVSPQKDSFGLGPAESNVILGHGNTKLLFTQPGKTYWAIVFKDEHSQPPKKRPSSEEDINVVAERFADLPFTENIKFRDLWETRERHGLLNIEEGILSKWHAGRIVLTGDSAFKMTADLGIGANIGIEAAVVLANLLHRELKTNPNRHLTQSELSALFTEYQSDRFDRAKAYVGLSGGVTRMHSFDSIFGRFFVSYVGPYLKPMQIGKFAESLAEAPKLDYVPVRTVNEDAEGWQLAKKNKKNADGANWLTYVLLTSTIGVAVAYVATIGLPILS